MNLTIWRHGEAGRAAVDRRRELTASGRDDIGFGCSRFHEACTARGIPHPGLVLFSSWVRTTQTAEIISAAFTHASVRAEAAIQPGSDVPEVNAVLDTVASAKKQEDHVLLVSHQPLVSQLVDYYLGAAGCAPPLSPGGLLTLSLDAVGPGCASLRFWALPPEYEAGL